MARRPRLQVEGGTYHVTAHAVTGARLYRGPDDLALFLELIDRTIRERRWACYAYCLMPTHYHLVVETRQPDLAAGMKWVNGCYAQRFNGRHGTRGHVFESRYYSGLIEREAHLLETIRYVALNPVRGGLCDDPVSWRWGSYGAAIGDAPAPAFLATRNVLRLFGGDPSVARKELRAFVADGVTTP